MFRLVYTKLRSIYNKLCKQYVSLIVEHSLAFIILYAFFIVISSIGLLNIKFITDNESLTSVQNSQIAEDIKYIEKHFVQDQKHRYFQHHLLDLGHYAEFIIKLKCFNERDVPSNSCNIINQTVLNEYNKFYDSVFNIYFTDVVQELDSRNQSDKERNYTYAELCPKRVNKCAVEGSLLRFASFQNSLLDKKIKYEKNDAKTMYIDADAGDGTSFDFLFGSRKYRTEICDSENCYLHGAVLVRNRFDLLSSTSRERELAVKFMHTFVQHLSDLEKSNEFKLFDFSYHTSHTVSHEIENYSKFDLKYVGLSFGLFWIVYFVLMCFDLKKLFSFISNIHDKKKSNLIKKNSMCIDSPFVLVLVALGQYVMTIISSLGLISIFAIPINSMLYTIIFILMINLCHQTLLLNKNMNNLKFSNYSDNEIKLTETRPSSNRNPYKPTSNFEDKLVQTAQRILIPSFCSLTTSVIAYTVIGFTSCFEAIKTYCFSIVICLLISFFGLVFFYIPCLVCNYRRVKQNRNCLLPCFTHESAHKTSSRHKSGNSINTEQTINHNNILNNKPNVQLPCPIPSTPSSTSSSSAASSEKHGNFYDIENIESKTNNNQSSSQIESTPCFGNSSTQNKTNKSHKLSRKKRLSKIFNNILNFNLNFIFNTNFKYILLAAFISYLTINLVVCILYSRVDLPFSSLLPSESYLAKHMEYHQKYFSLGPVIMLNFIKPLNYNDNRTHSKMRSLIDDLKNVKGMTQFELSWLEETKAKQKEKNYYQEEKCKYIDSFDCFYDSLNEVLNFPQYYDDVNFATKNKTNSTNEKNFEITSSRVYIQFETFLGTMDELKLMNSLKSLAEEKYNMTKDKLILFSPVYLYLEQLDEINISFISIFILAFECIFLGGLVLIFDLKSVLILMLAASSLLLSIFSNVFIMGISLNVVTLFQFIMVPFFIFDFFYHTAYLFLFKNENSTKKQINNNNNVSITSKSLIPEESSSNCSMSSLENKNNRLFKFFCGKRSSVESEKARILYLKFIFNNYTQTTCSYLIFNLFFSFFFMCFCSTYNFHTLFIILTSISLNLLIHLLLFYPVLLVQFGPCWSERKKNVIKH